MAIQLELETYDYSNPQLPYLEDMMDLEFLSADGQVLAAMRDGLYTYEGFDLLTVVLVWPRGFEPPRCATQFAIGASLRCRLSCLLLIGLSPRWLRHRRRIGHALLNPTTPFALTK